MKGGLRLDSREGLRRGGQSGSPIVPGDPERSLLIEALRHEVGDDAFFSLLRDYYQRFAYGNAGTDDFIAVAEEVSGMELDELFEAWLYGADVPRLPVG